MQKVELTNYEIRLIILLLKAERGTIRFLTGSGKPSEEELMKEKFLDKLIDKFYGSK